MAKKMLLKPSFHILTLSLDIVGIGGLLDLLKGEPEANVPGDQAEAGGIESLKSFFLSHHHNFYVSFVFFVYFVHFLLSRIPCRRPLPPLL